MSPPFCKHCQGLIASVIKYFESERNNRGSLLPLTQVRQRAADALGISINSVCKVSRIVISGKPLAGPAKPRRSKTITNISDDQAVEIRNMIYQMQAEKEHVTVQSLWAKLVDRQLFEGSRSSLWRVLRRIGFRFKQENNCRTLMELPQIVFKRTNFLSGFMKNLCSKHPRNIVFLDETWVLENGTISTRSMQDGTAKNARYPKVDGNWSIVLHAGGRRGFVQDANLILTSKTNTAEMNEATFIKWFEEQLLPHLEEPSLIIMDDASYHSALVETIPTSNAKKQDMQQWLHDHNIPFEDTMLKSQLLGLIHSHKPPKKFKVDEMALHHGHEVLRLPPYHCIFNPLKLIWQMVKNYYNTHMGRDGTGWEHSLAMWQEALCQITPEIWSNSVQHTEETIAAWWEREQLLDQQEVAPLIIGFEGDSDQDSDHWGDFDSD